MSLIQNLRGGEFLVKNADPSTIFIPEEFDEEQLMLGDAVSTFVKTEVVPHFDKIETQEDPWLVPSLLEKAAELGMLGLAIPEEYGGSGVSFNTDLYLTEAMAFGGSFAAAFGVQTGIGMIPIVYYGTSEQKEKYLPRLVSGELKCCYCLTEPDAGSDANSGKTRAMLNEAGTHYLLSGQKMWITNGGFANLFIVFAKVDDDEDLSAFILEEGFGGIKKGDEEKKMGLKGSSTVQLFFDQVPVPVDNMLGKRGEGFKMALNTLNVGRIKLAAGVMGGIKHNIGAGVDYAVNRKQFGKSLYEFGAIKYKIGEMMARSFAVESAVYRAGKDMELEMVRLEKEEGMTPIRAKMKSIEQYSVECAVLKVYGSEVAGYIVDEGVQIFGGMGFSEDGPVARPYRDARILRIFEGTNEINRMLSVGMFFKKVAKTKEIDLKKAVGKAFLSLLGQWFGGAGSGMAGAEKSILNLKRLFQLVAARAATSLQLKLIDEQEILLNLADMAIDIYTAESAILRTQKLKQAGKLEASRLELAEAISQVLAYEAVERSRKSAREAILSFATGAERGMLLLAMRKFTRGLTVNVKELRRLIADQVVGLGKYPF